jgi:hypothetical protein
MALVSLLMGFVVLAAGLALARWYAAADPRRLAAVVRPALITLAGSAAVLLAFTGRLWLLALVAPLVVPVVRGLLRKPAAELGGGASGRSAIRTRFLEMRLDHATGLLDGAIIDGPEAGRDLSALPIAALVRLLQHYQLQDTQSALVLSAYLDRTHPHWREAAPEASYDAESPGAPMSRDDAYRILGLAIGASEREIEAAHRRLIALVHPDKGGSSFLAAQVNRARDVLLGR